jgi:fluoride exporter
VTRPRHPGWAVVSAVAVGGAVGTLVRWGLVDLVAASDNPVAGWVTLGLVNLSGSFLLGMLAGLSSRLSLPVWLVAGLGVGALGAYTSLSAVVLAATTTTALGLAGFIQTGAPGVGSLVTGLVGTALALMAGAALGTASGAAGLWAGGWRPAS